MTGQMALRLHQMTGEPLAHCSYLLNQTNGDYETALKILERILAQRKAGTGEEGDHPAGAPPVEEPPASPAESLEERVLRLENHVLLLTATLDAVSGKLSEILDHLSPPAEQE